LGSTYFIVEKPDATSLVLDWFRGLESPPNELAADRYTMLFFPEYGALARDDDGPPDPKSSPVVSFYPPRVTHGSLWTTAEVHFLTTPIGKIPQMATLSRRFAKWLESIDGGAIWPREESPWSYYLEGSIQNVADKIYALPSGLTALERQTYYVTDRDATLDLAPLCKKLRLRGIDCG
jgi:hypothetical protein